MKPNLYQREMAKFSEKLGCIHKFYEDTGWYSIRYDGNEIATIKPDGISFRECKTGKAMANHHNAAWEMYKAFENAPSLPNSPDSAYGVYRQLSSFGGAVFAARESGSQGMEFVTWLYTYDRKGYTLGHYFGNEYENAKRDFATRSGLVSEKEFFSKKELDTIHDSLKALSESGELWNTETDDILRKIESLRPERYEEQDQESGLEMT